MVGKRSAMVSTQRTGGRSISADSPTSWPRSRVRQQERTMMTLARSPTSVIVVVVAKRQGLCTARTEIRRPAAPSVTRYVAVSRLISPPSLRWRENVPR